MALTDENGMNATMLVTPTGGVPYGGGYGGGNGLFGGGDSWLGILFLIALCNGGFGFGGGFGGGYGNMMLGYDFPWLLNGQNGINNNVSMFILICNLRVIFKRAKFLAQATIDAFLCINLWI